MNIYIIGAGGHARVVLEIAEDYWNSIFLIDRFTEQKELFGYPILAEVPEVVDSLNDKFIVALGDNAIRKKVAQEFPFAFDTLIHRSANMSPRIHVGAGSVFMAGVSVNTECIIGEHVILNTNCNVDHNCVIGNFVHISPNAALAGNVTIGEGTHVGIGSSIIQGVNVGRWVTVGAGAVVVKDIPDYAVVVGVPGKIIKYNFKK